MTVDFTEAEDVLQILPRSPLRSSESLGWSHLYLQQHRQPAWETPDYAQTRHMLLIHHSDAVVQAERWFDGHRQSEQFGSGNNIVIVPAMVQHRANWNQESPFALLFLEPEQLSQVAFESVAARVRLLPHHAMHDALIAEIGRALNSELDSNLSGSPLFADSLAIALSIHLIRHYSDWQQPLPELSRGLSPRQLQQAIDYIQAHLAEDLSIRAIADQVEMSQYYFSRLFKQSTGVSPYQYVMQQRIERAAALLRTTSLSVAAIAVQVGFANQNQLTVQFRKLMNTTPSHYRKQL